MADAPAAHIGENSPEQIAFKLLERIRVQESEAFERKKYLDTYAECLSTVRNPEGRLQQSKPRARVSRDDDD